MKLKYHQKVFQDFKNINKSIEYYIALETA